jgi:hypothetical protein
MRIGLLAPDNACGLYRGVFPLQALERREHTIVWGTGLRGRDARRRALLGCDLVHTSRISVDAREVRRLHNAGVAVTWDIDDDISAIPADAGILAPVGGKVGREKLVRQMRQVAALVDGITTTTSYMSSLYAAPENAPISVIDNSLPSWFSASDAGREDGSLAIGWVAGTEHAFDAQRLALPRTIQQLLEAHTKVRFISIGIELGLSHPRYDHRGFVAYDELPRHIAEFDIGIAPLCEMPLNRARSTIKVKEYAALGVPWLASARTPFIGLGERAGGRLVDDGGWYKALDRLIRRGRRRRQLARNARAWARGESIDAYAPLWERAFEAALDRASARSRRPTRPTGAGLPQPSS